jgi:hypothetical protein
VRLAILVAVLFSTALFSPPLLSTALLSTALFPAAGQGQPVTVARVAWLQGCWENVSAQRTIDEQWMAPRGNVMIGMSRTMQDGALREYELVLIRQTPAGLAYEAHPSGQPAATFPLKEITDASVVFEDPAHDFPQRVGYRRDDADRITAWIEGTTNGKPRRIEYPYRRARCPS